MVVAGLNGWWTASELAYGVQLSDLPSIMGNGPRLARIAEAGIEIGVPVADLDDVLARAEQRDATALPTVDIDEDDPLLILFTSGTTGRPKGATLSHRNLIHFGLANAAGPGGVGGARGAAVGHWRQRRHRCAGRRSSTSRAPRRCS